MNLPGYIETKALLDALDDHSCWEKRQLIAILEELPDASVAVAEGGLQRQPQGDGYESVHSGHLQSRGAIKFDVEKAFEPWCAECPRLDPVMESIYSNDQIRTIVLTCSHIEGCRCTVKSALRRLAEVETPFPKSEPARPKTGLDHIREMGVEEILDLFLQDDPCPPPMATVSCDGSISCRLCWIRYLDNPAGRVMPTLDIGK